MKKEIIYTEHYALIVSDEEVVEGDFLFCIENKNLMIGGITSGQLRFLDSEIFKKIIAHRPLTDVPILKDVPLLPEFKFSKENDVVTWACRTYPFGNAERNAFIAGYNRTKEVHKYTEQMAREIWKAGQEYWETSGATITFEELTEKLLQPPKPPFSFECVMVCDQCSDDDSTETCYCYFGSYKKLPKTVINSQGQVELVGEYFF